MTIKEVSLKRMSVEQFLSRTNLFEIIPDWDGYGYGNDLFVDKENLINMIAYVIVFKNDRRTIQLWEYNFMPFNVPLAEVKQMIENDKTIDVAQIAGQLILKYRLASWHQVWNYGIESYHLDALTKTKAIVSSSSLDSDKEAQDLLDKWCRLIAPGSAVAGDYFQTGKIIELEILSYT